MVSRVEEDKWRLNKYKEPRRPFDKDKKEVIKEWVKMALKQKLYYTSE